ncbi:2-polyprenyl-3-methyl-5-hydroxy-6-metoxy-1,4-benzoquinol methylase [Okibacterium sp. HSC-33S16]|uniref:class I SAM-dependent methyltransferase n=1 Tax=Okibacterium sp. HSC-33S16 TaxID=2910965 RepID=UPI0020A1AC5A|nr:class I SAM-dependent methyltransferase [Okibacterium sp. HSC-33S16]MCP2032727.1 2-polyprenyl-3-methyl-5-hydroxy-6-metoxy-1,4-benzoquinol methylase [Okibacterium sp. HSC-33S16]
MTAVIGAPRGWLQTRDTEATERMDDPDCDLPTLFRTYAQFPIVNGVVAGWAITYRNEIRPRLTGTHHTLLDIGCGGGDVARALVRLARRDGITLAVTAIDPDPRATAYVRGLPPTDGVAYRQCTSGQMVEEGAKFDVVISNHVLHHLSPVELGGILADSEHLASRIAIHSDIRRTRLGYVLYGIITGLLFHRSFVREDGLISIRRSFLPNELRQVLPRRWRVRSQPFFRTLAIFEPND